MCRGQKWLRQASSIVAVKSTSWISLPQGWLERMLPNSQTYYSSASIDRESREQALQSLGFAKLLPPLSSAGGASVALP